MPARRVWPPVLAGWAAPEIGRGALDRREAPHLPSARSRPKTLCKFPLSDKNSLLSLQKFPARLRREFSKPLKLPRDFRAKIAEKGRKLKNSLLNSLLSGNLPWLRPPVEQLPDQAEKQQMHLDAPTTFGGVHSRQSPMRWRGRPEAVGSTLPITAVFGQKTATIASAAKPLLAAGWQQIPKAT
jgi:hypothetical protein